MYNIDKEGDNGDAEDSDTKDSATISGEVAKLENNDNSKKIGLNERLLTRRPNSSVSLETLRESSLASEMKLISLLSEVVRVI